MSIIINCAYKNLMQCLSSYQDSYSSYHYSDVIMSTMASQITSLTIVYSTVYSGAYQSKHQGSASLAFVWRIHRGQVNSSRKWRVTRKMFPFDDVIMCAYCLCRRFSSWNCNFLSVFCAYVKSAISGCENVKCAGYFHHKGPVTRKIFSFDDVIMIMSRDTSTEF